MMKPKDAVEPKTPFTGYQKFVVALLAFLQFTIILDFMILSPLGAILLQKLQIDTGRFGLVVSVYAFSAGISGILAAGFADRFDRKKLLLFFYAGFLLGTFLCGLAPTYPLLLGARVVTGVFGGVIGSISFAIIADLFPMQMRGRVMGVVQSSFAASQVMGIPIGLFLANRFGWHAPFLMIAGVGVVVGVVIVVHLKPLDAHLDGVTHRHPLKHILSTATNPRYLAGFTATMLMACGGFMLMPFGSAFSVHNLGISLDRLPLVYMATGLAAMAAGPLLGRLADSIGKFRMLCISTLLSCAVVLWYTGFGITPIALVIFVNCLMFIAITGRMVSTMSMTSAIPAPPDRGAYMAVSSSMQQLSGGVAASVAGLIVVQNASGKLEHYQTLGCVVAAIMLLTLALMYNVNRIIRTPAVAR
jgi:predicted MFS family arabinose efflux permease